jgi:hypothetical protein
MSRGINHDFVSRMDHAQLRLKASIVVSYSLGMHVRVQPDGPLLAARRFAIAQAGQKRDPGLETAGNLANVG